MKINTQKAVFPIQSFARIEKVIRGECLPDPLFTRAAVDEELNRVCSDLANIHLNSQYYAQGTCINISDSEWRIIALFSARPSYNDSVYILGYKLYTIEKTGMTHLVDMLRSHHPPISNRTVWLPILISYNILHDFHTEIRKIMDRLPQSLTLTLNLPHILHTSSTICERGFRPIDKLEIYDNMRGDTE